jgi:autotransporter-associated beta strand protein
MKPRPNPLLRPALLAAASFALAVSAGASNITWQSPQAISASTDVNTQGTLFTSKSTGGDYTVNGVFFTTANVNFAESFNTGAVGFMNGQTYIGTNDTDGQNYAGLMNVAHLFNPDSNAEATITFSNLTTNQEYLVQLWVADYRGYPNDRYLTLTGGSNTSGQLKYLDSDNSNGGIHGSYVIGTFSADATSQAILINSNQSTQMQAVQLRAAETNVTWNNNASNMTWSSSAGNWSVGPGWQYATNNAVFGSTGAGTVNLAAEAIGVHNITFDAVGYTIAGNTLTLNNSTITTNADAAISSALAGSTGLIKAGGSTLTLEGTNTYTGATNVNAGKLLINGDNSAATGALTVASGATLGGTGTVGGATTIQSGGHLAVGNSPGTQTFSNSLTFNSGSIFDWELDAETSDPGANTANSGTYDKVVANGSVTGSSVFTIALGTNAFTHAFWDTNKTWTDIFTGTGSFDLSSIFTTFGGAGVASNGLVTGQGQFSFTSNTLNWTAVPEPTSALAGLLITAGLLRRRRA